MFSYINKDATRQERADRDGAMPGLLEAINQRLKQAQADRLELNSLKQLLLSQQQQQQQQQQQRLLLSEQQRSELQQHDLRHQQNQHMLLSKQQQLELQQQPHHWQHLLSQPEAEHEVQHLQQLEQHSHLLSKQQQQQYQHLLSQHADLRQAVAAWEARMATATAAEAADALLLKQMVPAIVLECAAVLATQQQYSVPPVAVAQAQAPQVQLESQAEGSPVRFQTSSNGSEKLSMIRTPGQSEAGPFLTAAAVASTAPAPAAGARGGKMVLPAAAASFKPIGACTAAVANILTSLAATAAAEAHLVSPSPAAAAIAAAAVAAEVTADTRVGSAAAAACCQDLLIKLRQLHAKKQQQCCGHCLDDAASNSRTAFACSTGSTVQYSTAVGSADDSQAAPCAAASAELSSVTVANTAPAVSTAAPAAAPAPAPAAVWSFAVSEELLGPDANSNAGSGSCWTADSHGMSHEVVEAIQQDHASAAEFLFGVAAAEAAAAAEAEAETWAVDEEGSAGAGSLRGWSDEAAETVPSDNTSSSSSGDGGCLAKAAAAAAAGLPGPKAGCTPEEFQQQNKMLLATYGYGIPGGYDDIHSNPLAEANSSADWPVRELCLSSSSSRGGGKARCQWDEQQGLLDMEAVEKEVAIMALHSQLNRLTHLVTQQLQALTHSSASQNTSVTGDSSISSAATHEELLTQLLPLQQAMKGVSQ